ncbi:MAG: recombinase family protein [Caulobacterales bacterium]
MRAAAPIKRCAIYTRKSSEEGLEQDFNSLHAQREACAAYISSQAGEGWRALPDFYDDGGFSGGNIERPALVRLLADIDAGKIDVIVVYKVDRLTRSLADFARIIERLEAKQASFVSVTQSFNSTTSMGRLTLNVLLSFAQFEREVTGERIRDKIAASKAKGLWMGGRPPFGYTPKGRTLEIDPVEADRVNFIFRRYLELKSVNALADDLGKRGVRGKAWTTRKGVVAGGDVMARGALYHLLRNPLYRGMIVHRGKVHEGQHAAIVDEATFAAVQALLDQQSGARAERPLRSEGSASGGSTLCGLLFDDAGHPMSPSATRGNTGKRHRYYVSKPALVGKAAEAGSCPRAPARALEDLVADRMRRALGESDATWPALRAALSQVIISRGAVTLRLSSAVASSKAMAIRDRLAAHDRLEEGDDGLRIIAPVQLVQRGGAVRLLDRHGRRLLDEIEPNQTLMRAVARGHDWRRLLLSGEYPTNRALGEAFGYGEEVVRKHLRLAFLAPDITRDILDGRHRPGLTLDQLLRSEIPLSWSAQRALFGAPRI